MITTGLILAGIAALVHIYIFYMESIAWTSRRVRSTFATSEAQADATKKMAFNQGFYNLFLAIAVISGIALYIAGQTLVGATLVFVGAGSMVAASLVLLISNHRMVRAAIVQGLIPAASVIALAIGVALST